MKVGEVWQDKAFPDSTIKIAEYVMEEVSYVVDTMNGCDERYLPPHQQLLMEIAWIEENYEKASG